MKQFENCPYLYEISNGEEKFYAFGQTQSEALEVVINEFYHAETEKLTIKMICFANKIINFE